MAEQAPTEAIRGKPLSLVRLFEVEALADRAHQYRGKQGVDCQGQLFIAPLQPVGQNVLIPAFSCDELPGQLTIEDAPPLPSGQ
jgi:hypothetical protein